MPYSYTSPTTIQQQNALAQSLLSGATQRQGAPLANALMGFTGGLALGDARSADKANTAYRQQFLSNLPSDPNAMAQYLIGAQDPNLQNAGIGLLTKTPSADYSVDSFGRMYNKRTGDFIGGDSGAPGPTMKAPKTATFYDEQGRPYTGEWDMKTGDWKKVGGSKGAMNVANPILSQRVDAGLQNILDEATAANNKGSLESAIGPLQGAEPNDIVGAAAAKAARLGGEVTNYLSGGELAPTEVRSNIRGATETLATAIKPLIRGPGEGTWTDSDQARLVSIVGDLATARDLPEFKRRLNAVKDRLKANFGLDLKFDASPDKTKIVPSGPASQADMAPQPDPQASRIANPGAPVPSSTDMQVLKANANNPQFVEAFNQKFGAGAADWFLTGGRNQ